MDDSKSTHQRFLLPLLAGAAILLGTHIAHNELIPLERPRPLYFADSSYWLLLQMLDFAGAVAAGVVAARHSSAKRWTAAVALLILALQVKYFADLPLTRTAFRTVIWHCTPLGILFGAAWQYRYGRPPLPAASKVNLLTTGPHTPLPLALGITAICFGLSVAASLSDTYSGQASGSFNDNRFMAAILTDAILASIALTVLHARKYPLRTLLPRASWQDMGTGVLLWLAAIAAWNVVLPIVGDSQAAQPIDTLLAEARLSVPVVLLLSVVNGMYEEVFLLGFLASGLRRFGASNAIAISLLVRLLTHTYQGPLGVLSVVVFGAVLGIYFFRTGRLFPVVAAHVLADAAALLNPGAT